MMRKRIRITNFQSMNDAEADREIARSRFLLERWTGALGMGNWVVAVNYHREYRSGESKGSSWMATMEVSSDWRYMQAYVDVYLPATSKLSNFELESTVVHELMHVMLNELRDTHDDDLEARKDHEERVATMLSRAILDVRDMVERGELKGYGEFDDPRDEKGD